MSIRLKLITGITVAVFAAIVGVGAYGYYSGQLGISADELDKKAQELKLPSSQNGVSVSIDDYVNQAAPGQTINIHAKINVPGGYKFNIENNGYFSVYVSEDSYSGYGYFGFSPTYGSKFVFPANLTEFTVPYTVKYQNSQTLYSSIYLSGRLVAQTGGGYGYGYGGGLISLFASHYTTISTGTITTPVLISAQPSSGATGVLTSIAPSAAFNQSLNPTLTNFVLTNSSNGQTVLGTVSYSDNSKTVKFTPKKKLDKNKTYNAKITWRNSAGASSMTIADWSFTTQK